MYVLSRLRIYGVFSLDCVIQTLLLMTGQASFGDKEQEHGLGLGRTPSSEFLKTLDLMRHLTEERSDMLVCLVFWGV